MTTSNSMAGWNYGSVERTKDINSAIFIEGNREQIVSISVDQIDELVSSLLKLKEEWKEKIIVNLPKSFKFEVVSKNSYEDDSKFSGYTACIDEITNENVIVMWNNGDHTKATSYCRNKVLEHLQKNIWRITEILEKGDM